MLTRRAQPLYKPANGAIQKVRAFGSREPG
jgi:hypothetical protein